MKFPETKTKVQKVAAILSTGLVHRLYHEYKTSGIKRSGMYVLDMKVDPLVDEGRDGIYTRLQFQDGVDFHNAFDWIKSSERPEEVIRWAEMDFQDMLRQLNDGGYDEVIDFDSYRNNLINEFA